MEEACLGAYMSPFTRSGDRGVCLVAGGRLQPLRRYLDRACGQNDVGWSLGYHKCRPRPPWMGIS